MQGRKYWYGMRTASEQVGAVVLGGAHGSLAVLRSLGRRGIPVWCITHDHTIPKLSRYCSRHFYWDGPLSETAVADLMAFAEKNNLHGWVLFPGADAEVMFISQNHSKLSSVFRLTTPAWETTRFAIDKRLTHECAMAAGVCYPRAYYPRSAHDVSQINCPFPLILKPTIRVGDDRFSRAKAWLVNNRTQLVSRYREAATLVDSDVISVQEFIPGTGANQYSYAAVWHQGRAIASLTARRKRQYPIDCGTGTCVKVVDEPRVEAASELFLRDLSYDGLVEIEFKYDEREDRFKLLDVNARAWGWIGLGSAVGIDFPLISWQSANGQRPEWVRKHASATWFHASRDLFAVCHEIARGNLSLLQTPERSSSRVFAAFAADDPLPGFLDLPLTLWRMLRRWTVSRVKAKASLDAGAKLQSPVTAGRTLAGGGSSIS